MAQVSIIILNYNTFELTCKCIESVIKWTTKVSYELILLDNASTENDPKLFTTRFPNLKLIQSKINLGFAKGNNQAIKEASGEVILLVNSDTELVEDSVSICYDVLIKNPSLGVITCKLMYPNGTIQYNCQSFPSLSKFVLEKLRVHKLWSKQQRSKRLQGFFWDYELPGNPDWVWGTFFMFKSNLLPKLPEKKLNEDYFMYVEDMKWCFDLSKLGYAINYTPSTKLIHHSGASAANSNDLVLKNQRHFLHKNYSFIKGWLLSKILT